MVSPDGRIKSVKVVGNGLNTGIAEQCILAKVKGWRLPGSKDGKEARVTMTLVFAS